MSSIAALTQDILPWLKRAFVASPRAQAPVLFASDHAAFQHAMTALAAKVVACDGAPQPAEYAAFETLFPFAQQDALKQRSLFIKHVSDRSGALQYARQIRAMGAHEDMREELLRRLLQIANSDAPLNAAELELLGGVASMWGIDRAQFRAQVSRFLLAGAESPYGVLRVSKRASSDEIRARYMEQVRFLHPDQYQAAGASEETIAILNDRLAAVNAAFEAIARQRGDMKRTGFARKAGLKNTKGADA